MVTTVRKRGHFDNSDLVDRPTDQIVSGKRVFGTNPEGAWIISCLPVIRAEPVVEVSRQIGSSISEASVCLQPLSHDFEAMLWLPSRKGSSVQHER